MNRRAPATVLLLLSVWTGHSSAALYKCTENGKTVFTDQACSDSAAAEAMDEYSSPSLSGEPREIDFGTSPMAKLIKVKAIFDSIEVDGRDCSWDLKVDSRQPDNCIRFVRQMGEGEAWSQANAVVRELLQDEAFYESNKVDFNRLLRSAQRSSEYLQFAEVRLLGPK